MNSVRLFFGAITFLTKIPIPYHPSIKNEDFCKNSRFFPLVGVILGVVIYLVGVISLSKLSNNMSALIIVLTSVILTGGLHLDGVGDSFDGLFSCRDKLKILEIMKDPRIGTNGILGIFFILFFKIFLISDLLELSLLIPILIMPIIGRMTLVLACFKGINARVAGMGKTYIGHIGLDDLIISAITLISSITLFSYSYGIDYTLKLLCATLMTLALSIIIRQWVYTKIDGITGDILGLLCETSETLFLIIILFIV